MQKQNGNPHEFSVHKNTFAKRFMILHGGGFVEILRATLVLILKVKLPEKADSFL